MTNWSCEVHSGFIAVPAASSESSALEFKPSLALLGVSRNLWQNDVYHKYKDMVGFNYFGLTWVCCLSLKSSVWLSLKFIAKGLSFQFYICQTQNAFSY